jgi:hypothetical protein
MLDGPHNYGDSQVRHLMINDFDTATQIDMNDVVATANNKMEFLLDKAEVFMYMYIYIFMYIYIYIYIYTYV